MKGKNEKITKKPSPGSLKDLVIKSKPVHKPIFHNFYTNVDVWPPIDKETENDIFDLLCHFLTKINPCVFLNLKKTNRVTTETSDYDLKIKNEVKIGFNSTIKALEKQIKNNEQILDYNYIGYVFVCRHDFNSILLESIFPTLTFLSSKKDQKKVKLIQLPKGSQKKFFELFKKNINVIGLTNKIKEAKPLYTFVDSKIQDFEIPFLKKN